MISSIQAEEKPPLILQKWSGEINVPDPVASTVDWQGRVYVTQTTRRKVADLDIREHTDWIPYDVALESIEEKRAFYHDVLAPGKTLRPRGELGDHNKDGIIDWKDLTVHSERLYRLEDADGDGKADKMTLFADGFNTEVTGIAAGILWHDGWVYTTIAPDLWRLRDTNDDGIADERESVVHGFGHHIAYAGHDMHGLCLGPDGRIYWSIGDKGTNVLTKEGTRVKVPHEGAVLRCEPDGSNFQVFARGLRNPQEIAFDEYGNLFTVDNDADKPGEKERFVYITRNSDSGWRCYYQYMKGYNPWVNEGLWKTWHKDQPSYITPPIALSHDGPAGFVYNPGTALGKAWERTFFLNLFPSGKTRALTVKPSGASFNLATDEEVSAGVMGIGMSWSPTGKLVFADWDGGYPLDDRGGVWTLDVESKLQSPERLEIAKILKAGFTKIEDDQLITLLDSPDQRVRLGAQFELVKRSKFDELQKVALNADKNLLSRIHAIWGLGQGLRHGKFEPGSELLSLLTGDHDPELRCQFAKVMGEAGKLPQEYADALISLLGDNNPRVIFHAAITLGEQKVSQASQALLATIKSNPFDDLVLRHGLVMGLAGCASEKELADTVNDEASTVRLASVLALRRQQKASVALFLKDPDQAIVAEAARAIHDDESIPDALPVLAALLDSKGQQSDSTVRRAINACYRLGGPQQAERLIKFALRSEVDNELRTEALHLINLWETPPALDRLDGRARQVASREKGEMGKAALPFVKQLMTVESKELKALAVSVVITYQLPVAVEMVGPTVMDRDAPEDVRVAAVELLTAQHPGSSELKSMLKQLLQDKNTPVSLRTTALDSQLKDNVDDAIAAAEVLLANGRTKERQKAVLVLAQAGSAKADEILVKYAEMLVNGTLPGSIRLEVYEAMEKRSAQQAVLAGLLERWKTSQLPLEGTVAAFAECLDGGDVKSGKAIALQHLAANCTACHRFDKKPGSEVGPPLFAIGKQRDMNHLLEALVAPAAQVTMGYGSVSATLKSGEMIVGVLVKEDAQSWTVRLADGTQKSLLFADMVTRTSPVSVMPPMGFILNKREIRDLLSYLGSLK